MGKPGVGRVVRLIQTLWDTGTVTALDDTELLACFLRHDAIAEAAFAALVHRYAPMVFRVCRDVTGDPHDAEDAAQATFLILAQKARFIRRREALANWLFGTARRVAIQARRDSGRRRRHEKKYAETIAGERYSDATGHERETETVALYEELDRLPQRYRTPIVMCDLEALTHEQAAVAIGCPARTLETRLYRGRERLRRRLIRRGVAPAVGLTSGALAAEAGTSTVPTAWAKATTVAAMGLVRGRAAGAVASTTVYSLFQGANRAMLLTRLKWTTAFVIVTGLCTGLTLGLAGIAPAFGLRRTVQNAAIRPAPRQVAAGPGITKADAPETKPQATPADASKSAPTMVPITVNGRATDATGKSVSGAKIYLVSTNGTNSVLGTTTTGDDGKFRILDVQLPVARPEPPFTSYGTFQVFGTAPGYGFAWHGMRYYMPRPRPAGSNIGAQDYSLYQGEPLVMDLHFTPAAVLRGRVVDERGRPVPGAKIPLGHCDYLDTANRESHQNFREFGALSQAPGELKTAKTDADGRFRLEGLPKEAGFWVFVEHPDFAGLSLCAATTNRPTTAFDYPRGRISTQPLPSVETGELNITVHSTRLIAVRTIFASTGRPAPRVRVSASEASSASASGANGEADVEGKLQFRLPPGGYGVTMDPATDDKNCVRTRSTFQVADAPARQSLELRINEGCILVLESVDAKTGKGIPGVTFMRELDDPPRARQPVQSRTDIVDHPRSDADGRLRAVVYPGEGVFSVWQVPESSGYREGREQKRVNLVAGQTVTVRFELEK